LSLGNVAKNMIITTAYLEPLVTKKNLRIKVFPGRVISTILLQSNVVIKTCYFGAKTITIRYMYNNHTITFFRDNFCLVCKVTHAHYPLIY